MVAKAVINRAIPTMRKTIESELPFQEKLEALIDFYIDLISKNTFVPLFILGEVNKHPQYFAEHILPKDLPQPQLFLQQLQEAVDKGQIRPIKAEHLVINIVAMCIFPFLAKPMAQIVLGMPEHEIQRFLSERRAVVKEFVFAALRPDSAAPPPLSR
jgi:TetR/AcrR family transcriptional regulator